MRIQSLNFAITMAKQMTDKRLSLKERKDLAFILYTKEGITQKNELAKRAYTTEKTVAKWIEDDKWERFRKNILITRTEQIQILLSELEELNAFIQKKAKGLRFADSKEADTRRKLIKDIKELETKASVSEVIETCKRVVQWLAPVDFSKSKEIAELFNQFIKDNLK